MLTNGRRWEFPENLAVGSITFGDVRRFWGALTTIAQLHDAAHSIAGRPKGSIVNLRSREEWTTLIAEIGGVSVTAASELLWWFTFDISVAEATAPIQPFLEVEAGRLCIPWSFAVTSNVERNLLKVLSRHPRLRAFADAIKAAKEGIALGDLSQLFPKPRFIAEPTVVIKGVTDADMVVYERDSGFVLVIQHKWLIAPETVAESSSNDEQLRIGALQAVESRDAFRLNHDLLRSALHLSSSDVIGDVEAAVICREAESTGFLERSPVPIVLERAFVGLWTKNSSLRQLWEQLNARPDHTEAASQFRDTFSRIDLAGFHFLVPVLAREVRL